MVSNDSPNLAAVASTVLEIFRSKVFRILPIRGKLAINFLTKIGPEVFLDVPEVRAKFK